MRSPAARSILGPVALLALGAAAYYVNQIEHQVTAARIAERAFDVSAREAANGLADLRVSQLAYVAAGTDAESWIPKVKETSGTSRRRSPSCDRRPRAKRPKRRSARPAT